MRVGVDGCRAGWFFVQFEGDTPTYGVIRRCSELIDRLPGDSVVLVDVPIGLRNEKGSAERLCDREARRRLAPKLSSSVFPAPSRWALSASSYAEACDRNVQMLGKKLSKQSWAIAPKIREVDDLLQEPEHARSTVREVHPEICFWGLRGTPMRHPKRTREGFNERLEILSRHLPVSRSVGANAFLNNGGYEVGRDDILDALVAVCCALRIVDCHTIPSAPERDERGLPMEMVYFPHAARSAISRCGQSVAGR